jgi:hypothetical protein
MQLRPAVQQIAAVSLRLVGTEPVQRPYVDELTVEIVEVVEK